MLLIKRIAKVGICLDLKMKIGFVLHCRSLATAINYRKYLSLGVLQKIKWQKYQRC
jgi:hypothetical protein